MIYVILADGFEEIEAIEPIDILKRGGANVTTLSIKEDKCVVGAHGISVIADKSIYDISNVEDMEVLILPGGAGHELLDASNEVHELINYAAENNLYVAAICASPSILGKKMILSGKNAVCFPGFEKYLYGANILSEQTIVDGKIITARGAGAASEFGFAILKELKNEKCANDLRRVMQYI